MHELLAEGAQKFLIQQKVYKDKAAQISNSNPSNQHIDDFNFGRVIQSQFEPTYFVMRHKPMNYLASCPMWSNRRKKAIEHDFLLIFELILRRCIGAYLLITGKCDKLRIFFL